MHQILLNVKPRLIVKKEVEDNQVSSKLFNNYKKEMQKLLS